VFRKIRFLTIGNTKPATTPNDGSLFWAENQRKLERSVVLVVED
jgi:hypothetical protein